MIQIMYSASQGPIPTCIHLERRLMLYGLCLSLFHLLLVVECWCSWQVLWFVYVSLQPLNVHDGWSCTHVLWMYTMDVSAHMSIDVFITCLVTCVNEPQNETVFWFGTESMLILTIIACFNYFSDNVASGIDAWYIGKKPCSFKYFLVC